jgi:polyisoprenyl-phosphate glycosyltransferase
MKKNTILYLVIPCYNEEEVILETTKRLTKKISDLIEKKEISKESKVLYVNDGSKDKTWELIKKIHNDNSMFTGLTLSRNRGHQNALLAGLMTAKKYADVVISMDADLQDDIGAIDGMLKKYEAGAEIVYGVRSARKTDTFFKKTTAEMFYKLMKKMGVDLVFNHADYRLASKKVLNELEKYNEVNLFLRGIFPLIGYNTSIVYYERNERFAGTSKYPLKKMLDFAWDGITSFSVKPIRFILFFGISLFLASSVALLVFIILILCKINISMFVIWLMILLVCLGIIEISIGLIGEYIGKTYIEVKRRPRYCISDILDNDK